MRYTYTQPVRYSETDETGHLSLGALIDLFQDTATMHSESVGYGVKYLKEQGLAWILASWQIEIAHMPEIGTKVQSTTWGYEFKGFYGMRNCVLTGEDGGVYAWSNSVWILFDVHKQRPVKISDEMIDRFGPEERYDMEYASRKLPVVKEGEAAEHFFITQAHLDTNHHVNNAQYVRFAQSYVPDGFPVSGMQVEYRGQAHLGDEICPVIYKEEKQVSVGLNGPDGKAFATVIFRG